MEIQQKNEVIGNACMSRQAESNTSQDETYGDPKSSLPHGTFETDCIICHSSENMCEIPDTSVHLVVTSPPYNVGKEYETGQSFEEWLRLIEKVFLEVRRVLTAGGRICINIGATGRNPYRPLYFYVMKLMYDLGFSMMRGEIIWFKSTGCNIGTAWGSWLSASNPVLRDTHEHILVFSKDRMKRDKTGRDTITRDEFLEYTKSVWTFPGESSGRVAHPTPFPIELPLRLIKLLSFEGDIVLDPFAGSGTSCVAAVLSGRRYIGYDIIPEYCELARQRISQAERSLQAINVAG